MAGRAPKTFHFTDYISISVYGFGLSALAASFGSIILPAKILGLVPRARKNTYLGSLAFVGLLLAVLVQPAAGAISDASRSRWGRRRPYILVGSAFAVVFSLMTALSGSYATVFISASLLQVASNTAQGPYQAFIPDLVPDRRRGTASGVKNVVEILGILVCSRMVAYLVDRSLMEDTDVWLSLAVGFLGAVLLAAALVTVLTVKEQAITEVPSTSPLERLRNTFKIDTSTRPDFMWFVLSRFFMVVAASSIQAFMLYYVQDVLDVPNPARFTTDVLVVAGICTLAVAYPAGHLSDRIGRKQLIVLSAFGGIVSLVSLIAARSYSHLLLSGAISGLSIGAFLSTNWALATDLVPLDEAARYLGLTNIATAGGAALARLQGPVIDLLNVRRPGSGYLVLFAVCVIFVLLGTGLLLRVQTQRGQAVQQPQQ